jgi:hypothetical protein
VPSLTDGYDGSGVVFWDVGDWVESEDNGTPPPPAGNTPPRIGDDPHENVRVTALAREQKAAFLRPDGKIVDVCGGGPCRAKR